ncbi:hypothetical protein [Azospirillum brasilense]|uniref:hypothetical protein n=1 Tax=Azospirillum brasilense TaxID=192 RepID=UPI001EDA53EC|nr:hypothetical protein [Azospirillum brasilense]UKJ74835.1 hypothetical protein H1Q64_20110 [Azospirillum brasilense]
MISVAAILSILSAPAMIIYSYKSRFPRWLQVIAKVLLAPYLLIVSTVGAIGTLPALPALVDVLRDDGCLQRYFDDELVVTSPTGLRKAVVNTGVCVSGPLAINSDDGTDIEITTPGTGKRVTVFKGYARSDKSVDLEWKEDGRLLVRLHKVIPVGKSLHNVDGVIIEYRVSQKAMGSLPTSSESAAQFRAWATGNAVID